MRSPIAKELEHVHNAFVNITKELEHASRYSHYYRTDFWRIYKAVDIHASVKVTEEGYLIYNASSVNGL